MMSGISDINLIIVIALLVLIIVVQNIIHKQERKDLYNRLMAVDLTEYKIATGKTGQKKVDNGIKKKMGEIDKKIISPE